MLGLALRHLDVSTDHDFSALLRPSEFERPTLSPVRPVPTASGGLLRPSLSTTTSLCRQFWTRHRGETTQSLPPTSSVMHVGYKRTATPSAQSWLGGGSPKDSRATALLPRTRRFGSQLLPFPFPTLTRPIDFGASTRLRLPRSWAR